MAVRNPIVHLNMNQIQTIGDAHLGRVFKTNVALDRRGEYEEQQFEEFERLLNASRPEGLEETNFVKCQVGDLFDKAVVSNQTVLRTLELLQLYETTAEEPIYIISGNHDDSKSVTEPTSWDVLAKFFDGSPNVFFVKDWAVHVFPDGSEVLFVGWNIHQNVAQAFIEAEKAGFKPTMVVCHLDRISYGNDDNVIPYQFLRSKDVVSVVTGHEHKPFHFWEGEMSVIGTGSLLPYSHAEDPDSEYYITIKGFEDVRDYFGSKGEDFFRNKHVRVYIEEENMDQFLALDLNCLSLQVNKAEAINMEDAVTEVVVESYDAKTIWNQSVAETGLDAEPAALLWAEIEMKGIENE